MILYKYVDYDTGIKILDNPSVAFTRPQALNDPFETSAGKYPNEHLQPLGAFPRYYATNVNFLILSLTRNPLNPIMWSHYGRSHTGFVFGIDCRLAGLNDDKECVLPAKYGSIIYTKSKPTHSYGGSENNAVIDGTLAEFDARSLEALQRIFLHKSVEWAYEEEVRVVKNLSKIPGTPGNDVADLMCPRFIVPISKESIVSVHVGKNPKREYLEMNEEMEQKIDLCKKITSLLPHIRMFDFGCETDSWNLVQRELRNDEWEDTIYNDYYPQSD